MVLAAQRAPLLRLRNMGIVEQHGDLAVVTVVTGVATL